jgi:general secretion pathway protein J
LSAIRRNKGFTLLEILIALLLLVIICGALYGTFFSLIRGREIAVAKMDARRELSMTLDQVRRELTSAIYRADDKRLHFVVEDRDYFGKPASTIDFTTITPPMERGVPSSDQAVIVYRAEEKEKKLVLYRQEKDLYASSVPVTYPQMTEVEGFLVECNDGDKWLRTWDSALNNRLPKSIRVTISVRDGDRSVNYSTIASPRIGS